MQSVGTKTLLAVACIVGIAGSGCTSASGPRGAAIIDAATTTVSASADSESRKFVLLDVSVRTDSGLPDASFSSFQKSFGAAAQQTRVPNVPFGRGDVVQLTIFENAGGGGGGLFVPEASAAGRPGNFVQLPQQTVDAAGDIRVPYAGTVRIAGRNAESVQREIEDKLKDRAVEPQVFITLVTQRASEVSVLGEVNQAGRFAVSQAGERIVDMISRAGGIKNQGYESFVTLQRGGRSVRVPFDRLVKAPEENVFVRPGDTVYVSREVRAYTILGATGTQSRVIFPAERLALAEALGAGGGLADARAHPGYVYLYRGEPRSLLEHLGADLSRFDPSQHVIPTIYKANLAEPTGLFAARRFEVRDKDVIYIADSESAELLKVLQIVGAVTGPIAQGTSSVYNARRANDF
ncbi:MAG: sugar ABC transporter substrate-binding protein [Chelatococcus sp.]|nr:MAG: sugar ABC transporter substrate-binding protein [Chelatococcus sp.]